MLRKVDKFKVVCVPVLSSSDITKATTSPARRACFILYSWELKLFLMKIITYLATLERQLSFIKGHKTTNKSIKHDNTTIFFSFEALFCFGGHWSHDPIQVYRWQNKMRGKNISEVSSETSGDTKETERLPRRLGASSERRPISLGFLRGPD